MRGIVYFKIVTLAIIALSITFTMAAGAGATTPTRPMSACLWVEDLPQGELITVTVVNHTQLNYYSGQGRYNFTIAGQPGEIIRVTVGGKEVQSFAYEPDTPAYLSFMYSDGNVTASTYQPGDPIPSPNLPTIPPEPDTERTGINLDGTWVAVIAFIMAIVAVGCVATMQRKNK